MGIAIRRLNLDTSWEMNWDDTRIVIDPWLIGSEVDYFAWFNQQWHTRSPILPEQISQPDVILISQSYSDHCHEETLRRFDPSIPILASPKAYKRLVKSFSKDRVKKLPLMSKDGFYDLGDIKIASIDPGRYFDPIYYAHIIVKDGIGIFYSSHGFQLTLEQLEILQEFEIELLLTSFSQIKLPSILGGAVNPGMENVNYLIDILKPKTILNTHDEKKKHQGLVMKLAKTSYPDYSKISFPESTFLHLADYDFHHL